MADSDAMACLEVRGGNVPADVAVNAPGLSMHVLSRPYHNSTSGGDVHFVSSCGTGRISRVMVADVAGHGSEVDQAARVLQKLMRRYVNRIDGRAFTKRMNDEFVTLTASGCFATAVVATYFAPTRTLSLVNAGHPPPLLYRAATQAWSAIEDEPIVSEPANLPPGVLERTVFESVELTLEPGDAVVIYTDDLPESRTADGDLLGYARLLGLARALSHGQPLREWVKQWLDAVEALSPGNLLADDLTVVLLRATEGATQGRLVERVRGITKMFTEPLRGRSVPMPELNVQNLGGSIVPWLSRVKHR